MKYTKRLFILTEEFLENLILFSPLCIIPCNISMRRSYF